VKTRDQKAYTRRETLQFSLGGALAAAGAVDRIASGAEIASTAPGKDTGAGPPSGRACSGPGITAPSGC